MQQNDHIQFRPQNQGYPAGGSTESKSADLSKRGVIVAPPSGNTVEPTLYTVLHRGFDTLAIAIQAQIGPDLFDALEATKGIAEAERRDVQFDYAGVRLLVKSHGGNGYQFIASGGDLGATWFFKKPNAKDKWGIRLSFGSFFLATRGLREAKAHLEDVLGRFGIRYRAEDVSISRADYCIDIYAPGFVAVPENFVMHGSAGRRDFMTDDDKVVHGKSGRVTSVTIGASRNRQVIIYDKRAETIAKSNLNFWKIWNDNLSRNNANLREFAQMRTLSPDPALAEQNRVWRVEFRAGRDLLKDTWNIRTWADFFARFGDLCRQSAEVVRYTDPDPSDSNRARWPNDKLWDVVSAEMNDDLCDMRSGHDPNPMKEVHRERHISLLYKALLGTGIAYAALHGAEFKDLPKALDKLGRDMQSDVLAHPIRAAKQLADAKERYVFIGPDRA